MVRMKPGGCRYFILFKSLVPLSTDGELFIYSTVCWFQFSSYYKILSKLIISTQIYFRKPYIICHCPGTLTEIYLPLPPKCWDQRYGPPHMAINSLKITLT